MMKRLTNVMSVQHVPTTTPNMRTTHVNATSLKATWGTEWTAMRQVRHSGRKKRLHMIAQWSREYRSPSDLMKSLHV